MRWKFAGLMALLLVFAPFVGAQEGASEDQSVEEMLRALTAEMAELRKGQQGIRRELLQIRQEIKNSAKAAPAARRPSVDLSKVTLSVEGEPRKGDADTRLVLMEFFDYQ